MKKLITLAIGLVACFCLNGCAMLPGAVAPAASVPSDTGAAQTQATETTVAGTGPTAAILSEIQPGYYVLGDNDTLQNLGKRSPLRSYSIPDSVVYTGQYMAMTDDQLKAVPTVTPDKNRLVYVQDDHFPCQNIVLERFDDKGYTFGISFTQDTASEYVTLSNPVIIPGTSAAGAFAGMLDLDAFAFYQLDGNNITIGQIPAYKESFFDITLNTTVTPDGVDTATTRTTGIDGLFENLTKDKEYVLSGFKGTVPVTIKLKADTRCLTPVDPIVVVPYLENFIFSTDPGKNYATINLPAGLASGYYVLNGDYLFYYDSGVAAPANGTTTTETTAAA